jgi:hypothetical protein
MKRMTTSKKDNVKSYKLALTDNIHFKKLYFLILSVALCGLFSCASIQTIKDTTEAEKLSALAMDTFINCTVKFAPSIDDGYSDASTIALALTNRCINEYDASISAYALAKLKSDRERQTFLQLKKTRDAKIAACLNIVLENRNKL